MATDDIRMIFIRRVENGWLVTIKDTDYVYRDDDELLDGLASILHKGN